MQAIASGLPIIYFINLISSISISKNAKANIKHTFHKLLPSFLSLIVALKVSTLLLS